MHLPGELLKILGMSADHLLALEASHDPYKTYMLLGASANVICNSIHSIECSFTHIASCLEKAPWQQEMDVLCCLHQAHSTNHQLHDTYTILTCWNLNSVMLYFTLVSDSCNGWSWNHNHQTNFSKESFVKLNRRHLSSCLRKSFIGLGRVLLDYRSFSPIFSARVFHARKWYLYCIHNIFTKTSKLLRKERLQNILGISEMKKTINVSLNFNEDEKFKGSLHVLWRTSNI